MSSERAIAHVLDQHVNSPGNVPATLAAAVRETFEAAIPDPATLDDDAEAELVGVYLDLRAKTTVTDSVHRAARIDLAVRRGQRSAERGSFIVA